MILKSLLLADNKLLIRRQKICSRLCATGFSAKFFDHVDNLEGLEIHV